MENGLQPAAWHPLRRFTPARIALGRAGGSIPTGALLEFRLAHARARDALLRPLDEEKLAADLADASGLEVLRLTSAARDLDEFLLRPDLGRRLDAPSVKQLDSRTVPPARPPADLSNAQARSSGEWKTGEPPVLLPSMATSAPSFRSPLSGLSSPPGHDKPDLVICVSEGLSTLAAETHAAAVVAALVPELRAAGWRLAPVCLVRRGRVAIEDHVGERLGARLALILLGERPGLISPDSLGAYLVHAPRRGNTDAARNCVSNISALGLTPAQAAGKLRWLLTEARWRAVSGVDLKDEFTPALASAPPVAALG